MKITIVFYKTEQIMSGSKKECWIATIPLFATWCSGQTFDDATIAAKALIQKNLSWYNKRLEASPEGAIVEEITVEI